MPTLSVPDRLRHLLRAVLLEERDLLESLSDQRHEPLPEAPGTFRCECTVALRRPLDPETAEWRTLTVSFRVTGEVVEIVDIEGLE